MHLKVSFPEMYGFKGQLPPTYTPYNCRILVQMPIIFICIWDIILFLLPNPHNLFDSIVPNDFGVSNHITKKAQVLFILATYAFSFVIPTGFEPVTL